MAMAILWNCAPRVTLGPAHLIYPEIRPIEIELRSFSFRPDHIAVLENQSPLTFNLKNTSPIKHNFTLIDNHRNVSMTIDIGPKKSITVVLKPLNPGNYSFYCNRFLHRLRGMEGMLMVD
jgi:uncharacterized cupredoxin-like copper-binding protein